MGYSVFYESGIEKGSSYRVTFTVSANTNSAVEYQSYCQYKNAPYTKYSELYKFTPTVAPPQEHSYVFTMEKESDPDAGLFFDLGGAGNNPIVITIDKIKVEKVIKSFEAALPPIISEGKVNNILSSTYENKISLLIAIRTMCRR